MNDTLNYLYGLRNRGSSYGIDRMRRLLPMLGNPHRRFPIIHVAGTNGKGSVCAMLDSIYRENGYKVGLFSSPHLVELGERIRVNGKVLPLHGIEEYVRFIINDAYMPRHAWSVEILDGRFGDRNVADDKAMLGGLGKIDKQSFMFIGTQKGYNTKTRQYRNFGMANPEGYRKALRLMKSAEKFGIPVLCLVDTPGAYPGLEAEERGQGEAIARNILEMSRLKTQVIVVIIGEGASGGALGIGVGDRVFMLENTWYSVISPESCSSILWRSWEHKEQAADALKLTAKDMKRLRIIDTIVKEPLGGAHRDRTQTFSTVRKSILKAYNELKDTPLDQLIIERQEKFFQMGVFQE